MGGGSLSSLRNECVGGLLPSPPRLYLTVILTPWRRKLGTGLEGDGACHQLQGAPSSQ